MAIQRALNCAFPQDLDAAADALLQEVGDRLSTINNIVDQLSEGGIENLLNQSNQNLNRLLQQGDGSSDIKSVDDLENLFGLEKDGANAKEDERFLFFAGIIMLMGIVYVSADESPNAADLQNIEVLRRIYLASGRNIERLRELLALNRTLVIHSAVVIKKVPSKGKKERFSTEEIQRILENDSIQSNDIGYNEDGSAVVITSQFLDFNIPISETKRRFNLQDHDISTTIIHHQEIDNSTRGINFFDRLGYQSEELSAILAGQDLVNLSPSPVFASVEESKSQAVSLIETIGFLLQRFDNLSPNDKESLRTRILARMSTLEDQHRNTITKSKFLVSVREDLDTLDNLEEKQTEEGLVCLFEQRPEISGIYFEATDEQLSNTLNQTASSSVESTTISNRFLNQQINEPISNRSLVLMASDLEQATEALERFTKSSLEDARRFLIQFNSRSPVPTPSPAVIFQGQPSMGTPSDVLMRRMDFGNTFDFDTKFDAVNDAVASLDQLFEENISGPIASVVNFLLLIINEANRACDAVLGRVRQEALALKQRIDSFLSKYLSLTGSGSFDSSLLKCAINFDIGVSAPLLDNLLALIDQLAAEVSRFIAKVAQVISELLEKILCVPVNLLNGFLGGIENNLPAACQLPRVDLGEPLETALSNLRNAAISRNQTVANFNRDLIRYGISVEAAPDKLDQFRQSSTCNTSPFQGFYQTALLNISGGVSL